MFSTYFNSSIGIILSIIIHVLFRMAKRRTRFENIVYDQIDSVIDSVALLKKKELEFDNERRTISLKLESISAGILDIVAKISDLELKINLVDNKFGSDIEYFADKLLVGLVGLTPFEDLKLYLNRKRDIMVSEIKRLLQIGIHNIDIEVLNLSWENIRRQLYSYADKVSPEFHEYNLLATPLRDEELQKFQYELFNAFKYGNGSREKIFADQVKAYLKYQLEFTFRDYQDYRASGEVKRREENNLNLREYLHSLIQKNNIEVALYEVQKHLNLVRNNELSSRLTLLIAKYNLYKKDEQLSYNFDSMKEDYNDLCRSLVSFIDSITSIV